jgi:curved DNA-binding protein CbpA
MSLYDDLGVPEDADEATIKKAFRSKAQQAHPDKGGNAEKFGELVRAYEVLSDPERRKTYDETGQTQGLPPVDVMAQEQLCQFFLEALNRCDDPATAKLLASVEKEVRQGIASWEEAIALTKRQLKKLDKGRKRLKKKGGKEGFLHRALDESAKRGKAALVQAEHNLQVGKRMLELLKDWEYESEERQAQAQSLFYQDAFRSGFNT